MELFKYQNITLYQKSLSKPYSYHLQDGIFTKNKKFSLLNIYFLIVSKITILGTLTSYCLHCYELIKHSELIRQKLVSNPPVVLKE